MDLFLLSLDQGRSRSPLQLPGGAAPPGRQALECSGCPWHWGTGGAGGSAAELASVPRPASPLQLLSSPLWPAACHLKVMPPGGRPQTRLTFPGVGMGRGGCLVCCASWALLGWVTAPPGGAQAKTPRPQVCSRGFQPQGGWPCPTPCPKTVGSSGVADTPTWDHLP